MPPRHLFVVLALTAAIAAPAAEAPDHPLAEHSDAVLIVDQRRVLDGAATAAPTSLWTDPDFARQRAHIEQQLELLLAGEPEAPPLIELLRHAGRSYLAVALSLPDPDTGFERELPMLFALDAGAAAPAMREWAERELMPTPETVTDEAAEAGVELEPQQAATVAAETTVEGPRTAFIDQIFAVGSPALLAAWQTAGAEMPDPGEPVAISRTGFGVLIAALGRLAAFDSELDRFLSTLMGADWAGSSPALTTRTWVDGEQGWRAEMVLDGLGDLPLGSLGASLIGRLPAQRDLLFAAALEPQAVADLVLDLVTLETGGEREAVAGQLDEMLRARTGIDRERIVATLTGELALTVGWAPDAMPIPKGVAVIGVRDGDTAAAVVNQLLRGVEAQATDVPGAHMAWSLAVPMQQLTIAVAADAVVVANRPDLAAAALVVEAEVAVPWAEGSAAHLELGLRSIGERWLPMGLAQLAMVDEPLGSDPLRVLHSARWNIDQRLQAEPAPTTVAGALFGDPDESAWQRRELAKVIPGDDLDAALEDRLAIWQRPAAEEGQMPGEAALVLRAQDGYQVILDWNDEHHEPDAVAARTRLAGYERVRGVTLEELVAIEIPERPRFDRRWLPSAPLAIRHLPQHYTLAIRPHDGGWTLSEDGLPLMSNYAHSAGLILAAALPSFAWQIEAAETRAKAEALRERHRAVITALETVGPVVADLRGELPATASGLVSGGHLELTAVAGLFGGDAPVEAAALDGVGHWNPTPEDWPQAVWWIPLEDGWAAWIDPWGDVEVSQAEPPAATVEAAVPVNGTEAGNDF